MNHSVHKPSRWIVDSNPCDFRANNNPHLAICARPPCPLQGTWRNVRRSRTRAINPTPKCRHICCLLDLVLSSEFNAWPIVTMLNLMLLLWRVVTVHYFGYSLSQENTTEYHQDTPTTAVPLLLAPIIARLHETAMAMRVKLLESTLLNTLRFLQHAGCLNLLDKICE